MSVTNHRLETQRDELISVIDLLKDFEGPQARYLLHTAIKRFNNAGSLLRARYYGSGDKKA